MISPGEAVTVAERRRRVRSELARCGVPTPDVDASALLAAALDLSPVELALRAGEPLPAAADRRLAGLVARRRRREPLQHILGRVGFRHVELEVTPDVFVPRPETEVLAGEAAARTPRGGVVVEPCTGSGAVAVSVASEAHPSMVVATDVDAAAVQLARVNAERAGVPVTVVQADLLDGVDPILRGAVDVIVANPPYLTDGEWTQLPPEVRHDPRRALVAGPTGHECTDRLLELAATWLLPGGSVLLETDEHRARETARHAAARGLVDVAVLPDLTGRDRVVVGRRESRTGAR